MTLGQLLTRAQAIIVTVAAPSVKANANPITHASRVMVTCYKCSKVPVSVWRGVQLPHVKSAI